MSLPDRVTKDRRENAANLSNRVHVERMQFGGVFQQTRYHGDGEITERQPFDARFDVAEPIGTIAGCRGRFLAALHEREPGVLDVLHE
jgi:hypothetical protein